MNQCLLQPYSHDKVLSALSLMSPLKSPCPNGLPPIFIQKYWHIVGAIIVRCVLKFLNSCNFLPRFNFLSFLSLSALPPESVSQFRPISLCNVVYTLASKAIANRLKQFLDSIISPFQSAFVPNRLITDNVLVAFELHHFLEHKKRGKVGLASLKLDMSKAYDRIEWGFLERVLDRLGFPQSFEAGASNNFKGVAVAKGAPRVSHLLFTDDSLIFSEATTKAFGCIKEILSKYEKASGQFINLQKSSVTFKGNTDLNLQPKKEIFQNLRERIWKKVMGWKEKLLSQAGKEVLIKSVLQAIPSYTMSCFLLPKTFVKELESILAYFWWGSLNEKKIHWILWTKLCESKRSGGMGFRDFEAFNLALMAKHVWRILKNPDTLLSKIFKEKYLARGSILEAKLGFNPSSTWRSLWKAIPLIKAGSRWRVGDGSNFQIWRDQWLPMIYVFIVDNLNL
ncbi:UNVERIFIED_CONTAM: hypothetical protein Sradi_4520000 [Sesamum radiatum]|uniref:Reverse transcriptase domain-containing protein n=1 Tax=Sesamum radiatum TaxID=300843 RepID=A0AAW2NAY2_SESRA